MTDEYMSFEKVLKELQIEEEELKKLVSEGEIKAFRDADQMKFDRNEIAKLMKKKPSGPDVIEILDTDKDSDTESAPTVDSESDLTDELSFDDDSESDVGMATAPISDDDFLSDDVGDGEAGEEVDLGTLEFDDDGELGEDDVSETSSMQAGGAARIKKSRIAGISEEREDTIEPQWALGLMIVSAIVLLLGVLVTVDIATSTPSPAVQWLVDMFKT